MTYQNDIVSVNRDLRLLAPKVREATEFCILECREHNVHVFEAWRSRQRQLELYNQGRTLPGKIVTNAFPWYSFHCYSMALDLAFKDKNGNWTWEGPWQEVTKVFLKNGFDKPPTFEKAHFQMSKGLHVAEAKKIYFEDGLQALWIKAGLV